MRTKKELNYDRNLIDIAKNCAIKEPSSDCRRSCKHGRKQPDTPRKCRRDPVRQTPHHRHHNEPTRQKKEITQQKTGRTRTCIPEYVDWVNVRPFHQTPIHLTYGERRIAQIMHYISTEKRKENAIRRKYGLGGTTNSMRERWQTGEIEDEADRLRKAADQNNMKLIWGSQRRLRRDINTRHVAIRRTYGAECQGMGETMKIWDEWTAECFS